MIDLIDVSKIYPVKGSDDVVALDHVNLHVKAGSIHGIVGQSGAGKSTLIRCLTALEKPTSGSIIVDDIDLSQLRGRDLRQARRKIGMVFQAANLFDAKTAGENIEFPLKVAAKKEFTREERKERVRELLALVGLEHRGGAYPSELSGGQRQRVGIARALSDTPQVLLCDEPTSALDPESTRAILSLLRQVRDETGVTIVIITHEMSVVREICDSVTLLKNGGIVQSGTIEEVLADPGSPLAKELVPAPSVDELDVTDFNRELTDREIAAQGDSAEDDTPAQASEDGNILLDVIFTSHPGVPTGSNMLNLAAKVGADVTAGTFESMGSVQVGRLALAIPAAQRSSIIDQLRAQGAHVEVRSL